MGPQLTPTQQRLRDMELLLRWEGELDNSRLREVFGVQAVQASRLLGSMQAEHGDSVTRETPRAPLTPTKGFKPSFAGPSPDEYLALIEAGGGDGVSSCVEDLRLDLAPVPASLFARVNHACRHRSGLVIDYRSMTHPEGGERLVFPHAMVRAARRWHMRAWCEQRRDFRDFALGRVGSAVGVAAMAPKVQEDDKNWRQLARLVVGAHPALNLARARLLSDEYLAGRDEMAVKVRRCLVSYTVQDLRIATDVRRQVPPEYQLALRNVSEFKAEFAMKYG